MFSSLKLGNSDHRKILSPKIQKIDFNKKFQDIELSYEAINLAFARALRYIKTRKLQLN